MKQSALERALPIVARTISEKYEGRLQVVVGGSRAYTNGRIIYLPTLPETNEARILARGYIDHEAGHIKYTNFNVQNDSMTNALEDIRIEMLLSQDFIGAKKNLAKLTDWFMEKGEITVSEQDSDHDVLAKYVHFKLRDRVLGHNVSSVLEPAEKELVRRFGKGLKAKADKIISPKMRGTTDASRRAKKLRALLAAESQGGEQEQQSQQGQAEGSGESGQPGQSDEEQQDGQGQQGQAGEPDKDKGDSDSGGSGEDQGESDQPGQSRESGDDTDGDADENESGDGGGAGSADGGDDENDAGGKGDGAGSGNAENDRDPEEETFQGLGEAAAEVLSQISQPAEAERDMDFKMPVVTKAPTDGLLHQETEKRLREAKAMSAGLRRKLQGVLEAKRRDRDRITRSGRKISCKKLYRLSCADTRIFARKTESRAVNTAVHLLLDTSASMSGLGLDKARQACYSMGLALESMKYVNLAISSFPGSTGLRELKKFGEPLRMNAFNIDAAGGTPTSPAMLYAAYTLAYQPEPRKMIFVITDGGPDYPEEVKSLERWLEQCGVEVFGLGINCPAVRNVFKEAIVVDDLNDLAGSIFKTLQKKL